MDPEPGITGEDGAALSIDGGGAVVESCAEEDCGPCNPCPWYWRAEHCFIPNCYVYICSDAACTDGTPIGDGTVFGFEGQCYTVSTATRYIPNPHDGNPPPDGSKYLPPMAVLVPDKTVECKGSCGECGGDCSGDWCLPGKLPYVPFNGTIPCLAQEDAPDCCCDQKGSVEWDGELTLFMDCGKGLVPEKHWTWHGSLTTVYNDAFPQGVTRLVLTAKREWYACNGNFTTTPFSEDVLNPSFNPCDHFFPGPRYFDGNWVDGVDLQNFTPGMVDWCNVSVGCLVGSVAFSLFQGGVLFRESFTRKPGKSNCGPQCHGGGSPYNPADPVPVDPNNGDPYNPAPPAIPGGIFPGRGGDCPRCTAAVVGARCVFCGWCGGCGG